MVPDDVIFGVLRRYVDSFRDYKWPDVLKCELSSDRDCGGVSLPIVWWSVGYEDELVEPIIIL